MSELRFEWKNMLAADLGEESCVPDSSWRTDSAEFVKVLFG